MKNTINKLILSISFFLGLVLTMAQLAPAPPKPDAGGIGGMPDPPTTPIDNYLYILIILAVMVLFFYKNKIKSLKNS